MANNRRLYYAIKSLAVGALGTSSFGSTQVVHGLQSASMRLNFDLEQVFELGQLAIYENVEKTPNIEINLERALDGYCPAYLLATAGATAATLVGRSNQKCHVAMNFFADDHEASSGNPLTEVVTSGAYFSSVRYQVPLEGKATETLSLVCNNRVWRGTGWQFTNGFPTNADSPLSLANSGGVQFRENIRFVHDSGLTAYRTAQSYSVIPTNLGTGKLGGIPGISSSGTNDKVLDEYGAHLQSWSVSCDARREDIFELGRKAPFHRYVNFPVEVTTEIVVLSQSGDMVSATEVGVGSNGSNLSDQTILLRMEEGLIVDCGTRNKLQSVSMEGADAGGGNETMTYTYTTFNDFTVYHPMDITTAIR